jgi:hypothetical protein
MEELKKHSVTRFDPYLVEQFVAIFQVGVNNEKKARRYELVLNPFI